MSEREKLERERDARNERKRRRASRGSHDGVATRSMRNAEQAHLEQPPYQENAARLPNSRTNLPDTYPVGPNMPSGQEPLHPMGSATSLAAGWARHSRSSPPPTRRSSDGELRNDQRHLERSPHREASYREEMGAQPRRHSAPDSTLRTPDRDLSISYPLPRQTPLSQSAKRNALSIVPRGDEICGNSPSSPTVQQAMFDLERFTSARTELNSHDRKIAFRSKPDPKAPANSASPRSRTANAAMDSPRPENVHEEIIDQGGGEVTDGDGEALKEMGRRSAGGETRAVRPHQDEEVVVEEGGQSNREEGGTEGDDDDDEAVKIVKTSASDNVVRGKNLRNRVVPPVAPRERPERESRTPPPAPPPKRRKRSPRKVVPVVEANHVHIYKTFEDVLAKEMGVVQLGNNGITSTTLEDVVIIKCNNMRIIQILNLSNNCIRKFPIMFEDVCCRIKVLNLAKNCLTKLDDWLFRACAKNLRQLNLSSNELTELPYNVKELVRLELLDVSMNRLTHLPSGLGDLEQLRYLNLADNNLTVLPEDLGFRNLRLTLFNISRNYDFESPFPEAMATHAYHVEDVFFDDTKLKDSLPRRVAEKPAPELVHHLTQLSLEEIRENWNKYEKERAVRFEKAQNRRR